MTLLWGPFTAVGLPLLGLRKGNELAISRFLDDWLRLSGYPHHGRVQKIGAIGEDVSCNFAPSDS